MGTLTHPITVIGPSGATPENLEAIVDTGATFPRFQHSSLSVWA